MRKATVLGGICMVVGTLFVMFGFLYILEYVLEFPNFAGAPNVETYPIIASIFIAIGGFLFYTAFRITRPRLKEEIPP